MKKYILIVIWADPTCENNTYEYWDYNRAVSAMNGFKMAFGDQIEWIEIMEK